MTNFSICIKSCLLGLLFSYTQLLPASHHDTLDTALYNQLTAEMPDRLDRSFAKRAEEFINNVNCMFGDLACFIQEQEEAIKITDKEQKAQLLLAIIQTRQVVNQLYRELMNQPTQHQLDIVLHIVNQLLQQVETALNTNFTTYKGFNIEDVVKRSTVDDTIDINALKEEFENTKKYFQKVQKLSENAGLYWYNHLYRNSLDRFIIQPCEKYNLHKKAFAAAVVAAGSTYVWYRMNRSIGGCSVEDAGLLPDAIPYQTWNENDPYWKQLLGKIHDAINGNIRHYLGWPSPTDGTYSERELRNKMKNIQRNLNHFWQSPEKGLPFLQTVTTLADMKIKQPRKWLAHVEEELYRQNIGWWALFMTGIYVPYKDMVNTEVQKLRNKFENKVKEWHYWAKGGAFYQKHKLKQNDFKMKPRFDFGDIIGHDHAKKILGDLLKYLQDPELYERAGLAPATGYLLFGPTRTGKTMIAEGLAGELQRIKGGNPDDFPFFSIDARYIASEGNFSFMMALVKEHAPCIIFIDEIDMLCLHRKFKDKNVLLSEFLSTLSGCLNNDPDKKVIIIAATNKPDDLDPSLRSRLSVHIPFEYPSFLHRAEAIMRELQGKGLPLEQFDLKKLAEQTETCSYEQIHKIINNAQFITRELGKPVTQADIEQSINTQMRNIIYHDDKNLSDDDLNLLSVHMAGHALAYMLIEGKSEQLSQVTIRPIKSKIEDESTVVNGLTSEPIIKYGHVFTHLLGDSLKFISKKDIKRKCMIELAGHVAEELIFDTHFNTQDSCSGQDRTKALNWAKKYFLDGIDEQLLRNSKAMNNKIMEQAHAFLESCETELHALFAQHKELIQFIADILRKTEMLDAEQLQEVVNLHKMLDGKSLDDFLAELQTQMQPNASETQETAA